MSSQLWAVDSEGRVFSLSHQDKEWTPMTYSGIEIKRLSALQGCIWAIGGDHQIYVFVPTIDVPIRVREVTFENQRWNPMSGFTNHLLPTDRPGWSSEDGLTSRYKEDIRLPTNNWAWEDDWYIESSLEGQPLAAECWTYSLDFPMYYGPHKRWNSMVRRRKWIRYRNYTEMNKWAPVPGYYDDPVREPFIDVAIGGLDIPGSEQEVVCVWAVTIIGRVMFRWGVTEDAPEGQGWLHVATPNGFEVHQISVGPTGLVWAVCWDGTALVRTFVTRDNYSGQDWIIVSPPQVECRISQISIGINVVWAITTEGKLWFRKGIQGHSCGTNELSATGTGWVEMVGKMILLSVGPNDQVWGLGQEDNSIFFRVGVTSTELSGKTWRPIVLPHGGAPLSRTGSMVSCNWISNEGSQESPLGVSYQSDSDYGSSVQMPKIREENFSEKLIDSAGVVSRSTVHSLDEGKLSCYLRTCRTNSDSSSVSSEASGTILDFVNESSNLDSCLDDDSLVMETQMFQLGPATRISNDKKSEGGPLILSTEAPSFIGDLPSMQWEQERHEDYEQFHYVEPSWLWISSGACEVDLAGAMPKWFSQASCLDSGHSAPWRHTILSRFQQRRQNEVHNFCQYPDAIEKSTWEKTGKCAALIDTKYWETTFLNLKRQDKSQTHTEARSMLECKTAKKKLLVNLSETTCIMNLSSTSRFIVGLFCGRKNLTQLSFASNHEMEDWLSTLVCAAWDQRSVALDAKQPYWALTRNGEAYLINTHKNLETAQPQHLFCRLLGGGHLRKVESSSSQVVWGLGYNNMAWIYSGGHGGGPFKGILGRNYKVFPMADTKCMYIYENQRWNPVTGFTARGLPTDRHMWSDRSGRQHCTKDNTKLPSLHWQWVTEWDVDYKTPGGVDKEGWQFASDFPRSYHAYKSFTDYVRRRRWFRRCKLSTTGPWIQAGTTRLLDISVQVDVPAAQSPISVWAVASNGEAIYRKGVTSTTPQGESWVPVPTEQPLVAISVGFVRNVWAISKSGTAYFRNGIGPSCPAGQVWFHVEPPNVGCVLQQISVGGSCVLAIDDQHRLWHRQEIVSVFPEGTSWKQVADNVLQVSVGNNDQIWAIVDLPETNGAICRRLGVTTENPTGTTWESISQGGWQHISCRGIPDQS